MVLCCSQKANLSNSTCRSGAFSKNFLLGFSKGNLTNTHYTEFYGKEANKKFYKLNENVGQQHHFEKCSCPRKKNVSRKWRERGEEKMSALVLPLSGQLALPCTFSEGKE
uniref:Uncharacterized protein n=1 Tax=Marseillevirus sp. TaxID=2809551 RepID=A0AA96ELA8_9VIRU|nr:hypothetical protein MarDSR_426 [Marseillevirus sp.]